ncbi:MAG: PEP-CTERM sorting domain-containing protein [Microcystis aeruginosa G11-01]|nr:PEP-CTERM sorting domain-containing protein [Microcystis aeruginosa G13-10]NCS37234.1 PEP-CTERM sorting domain-containing protein [Microcystis aeruginosa G11-01]
MITNISRQLTTGALAIAGSVAAFGFAGAAPAQAQAVCPLPLGQLLLGFKDEACRVGDKLFTFYASSPTFGAIDNGVLLIDQILTSTIDRHTFNYRPTPALTQGSTFIIDYTIEIVNDPDTTENELLTKMFKDFSIGYDATGAGNSGITVDKTVWLDAFGGSSLIGSSMASSSTSASGAMVPVPADVKKLFVRDTFSVSSSMGSLNSITNDFTQKKSIDIPEPSAILGILAVAGAGAFARRKS